MMNKRFTCTCIVLVSNIVRETAGFSVVGRSSCTTSPLFSDSARSLEKKYSTDRIMHKNVLNEFQLSSSSSPSGDELVTSSAGLVKKSNSEEKSIFTRFDDYCLNLKPRAIQANAKAQTFVDDQGKKILYTAKSCGLFSLFIVYRAYRGFFYILPEVFREVYRKMEKTVNDPFLDDEKTTVNGDDDSSKMVANDVDPKTGQIRLRTRVVVSILTTFVTFSYVVTGAFEVLKRFVATATRTSSVEPAFEAAADEILTNEGKIMKLADKKRIQPNGEGLAP